MMDVRDSGIGIHKKKQRKTANVIRGGKINQNPVGKLSIAFDPASLGTSNTHGDNVIISPIMNKYKNAGTVW